jgi:lysyl-tRNA synthetase class 2
MLHTMTDLWRKRFLIERSVREYFWSLGYEETRTPLLVKSPGMEPHICPIEIRHPHSKMPVFLPTSPEFAMKKLLARGMTRIFQICSSFRDEPTSPDHHPEFSMLEFYEAHCSLEQLQERVENLFLFVAQKTLNQTSVTFRETQIDLKTPWPRFRVSDLFQKEVGIDLRMHQKASELAAVCQKHQIIADASESWDDLYFKLWLNLIEPKLPKDRPVFVTHYPVSQSSLCNRVKDETGFEWANRFEVYVGQLELGNAFDELRDEKIQRENFLKDQKIRCETYGSQFPESPLDEEFLNLISKMPPTSGIALGLDRICMLMLNAKNIDEIIPLRSTWR